MDKQMKKSLIFIVSTLLVGGCNSEHDSKHWGRKRKP